MKFLTSLVLLFITCSLVNCSSIENVDHNSESSIIQNNDLNSGVSSTNNQSVAFSITLPNEQFCIESLTVGAIYELNIVPICEKTLFIDYLKVCASTDAVTIKPAKAYSYNIDYREIKYLLFINAVEDCFDLNVNYKATALTKTYRINRNNLSFSFVSFKKSHWNAKDELLIAQNNNDYFKLCSDNNINYISQDDDAFLNNDLILVHQFANFSLISIEFVTTLKFDSALYFQIFAEYETDKYIGYSRFEYVFYVFVPKNSYQTLKKNFISFVK